ncbi:MAG: Uma2 family endonuclease [Chloroflexales bacterium]|jgi:Uma2 family endonuclease
MTVTADRAMRSLDASWNRARWELLPSDGNRYEVIDGVLYMTTAPSSFHQWIIRQITRSLYTQIDDCSVGLTYFAPIGVFMPGCDPVQPDILVVRTENTGILFDRRIFGVPTLIVEVLSPSNAEQDLITKRDAYAHAGVPEYWIVRPATRDLLLYATPVDGIYRIATTIAPDDTVTSTVLPFHAAIAGFFRGSPDEAI